MINEAVFCMAVGLYFEARAESFYGRLLVANVIENRVQSKHYPKNVCDVIKQPKQFSFFNNVSKENPAHIKNHKSFYKMIATAEYYYKHNPYLTDACHYATHAVSNNWTLEYEMVATTVGHAFYEGGCNDIKGRKRTNTREFAQL